ncbi:MAG: type II toxin-antitoxin system VapC family toxin [Magnetococcales bacterium]|nr:type II toxin-antitoxin system VapC family toxin [Magnetococcales bacterium]
MGLNRAVYLDACIAIYLVEEHPQYVAAIENSLADFEGIICHSALVELESLVLPLRQGREILIRKFRRFFAVGRRLPMTDAVFMLATDLRTHHNLKTPDALHLAAAMHHGCDAFWTHDDRLAAVAPDLAVNILNGCGSS